MLRVFSRFSIASCAVGVRRESPSKTRLAPAYPAGGSSHVILEVLQGIVEIGCGPKSFETTCFQGTGWPGCRAQRGNNLNFAMPQFLGPRQMELAIGFRFENEGDRTHMGKLERWESLGNTREMSQRRTPTEEAPARTEPRPPRKH